MVKMSYSRLLLVMSKLLICLPFFLFGEDLVVHLATDAPESRTIYLAKLTPCETNYQKTVNETLFFDFKHNVKTKLIEVNDLRQACAHHKDPNVAFQSQKWQEWNTSYVVIPEMTQDTLNIKLFDVHKATLKTLHPIPLTYDLSKDLREIHKASDLIYRIVYGEEGIASKRILYSYQPKVSPEEDKIWHAEIWEMDYDGRNQRQITEENHYSITPTFIPNQAHPDNYSFLYVTYKQGQPRIYMTDRNRPRGKPFITLKGNQLLPSVSLKRDKIAFISDASGRADLFVQNFHPDRGISGKPLQIYSLPDTVQASPTFSPDGTKIAFVSDKSGFPAIYIVDINEVAKDRKTPMAELITKKSRDNSGPSWSRDGKKIAYSAKTNGVRQIWIYDIDTKEERQVTMGMGNKENPSFAPDSVHIVYNTTSPTCEIFLLNTEKGESICLTSGPGQKHYPVFEP